MERDFMALLKAKWAEGKFVCVGLDTDMKKLPPSVYAGTNNPTDAVAKFNYAIIDATHDLVCAYKPNIAFYEGMEGGIGMDVLLRTMRYIRKVAPSVPVILDAKRGDIGNSNEGYIRSAFKRIEADAITINPYMGQEANQPFLDCKDKGIFVLCRTSNEGADEFQNCILVAADPPNRSMPLYEYVADRVSRYWNVNGNCGLVVGATAPEELARVRARVGDGMPILIPGVGAQGGDLEQVVHNGMDSRGEGIVVNIARSVLYASKGPDFASAGCEEVIRTNQKISQYRKQ